MAQNVIPTSPGNLSVLGGRMHQGLVALGTTLGITQITPVSFLAKLTSYQQSETAFNNARSSRQNAAETFNAANEDSAKWILKARGVLTSSLGARWSANWVAAGFTTPSTAVPTRVDERIALLYNLQQYFTANPSTEAPGSEVTAGAAESQYGTMTQSESDRATADALVKEKDALRATAREALVGAMNLVIGILHPLLGKMDPRWEQFGLNIPGTRITPGQPQELTAFVGPEGQIEASCAPLALAQRYRWRVKVEGLGGLTLAASTAEPHATITGLDRGQTVLLCVQGVNGGSQGVASDLLAVEIPPVLVAKPAPMPVVPPVEVAEVVPRMALPINGSNGHGSNGHAPEEGELAGSRR